MSKDEALDLALEALEDRSSLMKWQKAITAIKQALAAQQEHEPENEPYVSLASVQEPVGYEYHEYRPYGAPGEIRINAILKSRYTMPDGSTAGDYQWLIDQHRANQNTIKLIPLYTTPPAAPKVVDCHATGVCVQSGLQAEKPAPVPTSWMEMVTANLVREGVNKHKARELAEHFYGLAPAAQLAPVQDLPFGIGGGLVAIKTLLSRDPCVHANTAIEMLDAILKEHPAAPEPVCKECNGSGEIETGIGMMACTDCPPAAQHEPENEPFVSLASVQEPVSLDGQRHLVEILVENWRVWPAQKAVEQTCLGDVYCSTKGRDLMFGNHEIAVDQDSAVVTKEMWSTMRQTLAAQPAPVQPVAWRAWFDADNGARWLFSLWPEEERLDVEWQPLFTSPPAQPAPVQEHEPENEPYVSLASVQEPVAWMFDCGNGGRMYAEDLDASVGWLPLYTTPPAAPVLEGRDWSLLEATQESLREHMAEIKRLKEAQPAVPDAMTSADIQEHIEYVAGWNDCRQAMLEMMK